MKSFVKRNLRFFALPTSMLQELHVFDFESYDGKELIPDYSTWKVKFEKKGKDRLYWLSTNESRKQTNKDTTLSTFPIVGIKGTWRRKKDVYNDDGKFGRVADKINVREILKKALEIKKNFQDSKILPNIQSNAISILEIQKRIRNFQVH